EGGGGGWRGGPRQSALLAARGQVLDTRARHRGVGRDHRVDPAGGDAVGDGGDAGVVEVGGDLDGERNAAPVLRGEPVALPCESAEECVELVGALQLAQV